MGSVRDTIGRAILAVLGGTAVVAGVLGLVGFIELESRTETLIVGIGGILNGALVVQFALTRERAARRRSWISLAILGVPLMLIGGPYFFLPGPTPDWAQRAVSGGTALTCLAAMIRQWGQATGTRD